MASDFDAFARAAAAQNTRAAPAPDLATRVAVLGGSAEGRLIAALALAAGCEVTLFSAYGRELDAMRASSGITLKGSGPIGSYHVGRDPGTSVQLTAELDRAVQGAEAVFLTGPVHKQRTYAMVLADHLTDGQILVLPQARSFGGAETAWNLRLGGCTADVTLAEYQGLPYWYREEGAALHLADAGAQRAACLPQGRKEALDKLAHIFPAQIAEPTALAAGFADLSAATEVPALIVGGAALSQGGIRVPMGGTALPENDSFAALIGPEQRRLIAQMTHERRLVAQAFGVRDLPETDAWIASVAGPEKGPGVRPVPNRAGALQMLRDGVLGSLVPLTSAADVAGLGVPQTRAMITLAGSILDADVAAAGRKLETMGLALQDPAAVRRAMDALTIGGR